jgi:hypothetical protein
MPWLTGLTTVFCRLPVFSRQVKELFGFDFIVKDGARGGTARLICFKVGYAKKALKDDNSCPSMLSNHGWKVLTFGH